MRIGGFVNGALFISSLLPAYYEDLIISQRKEIRLWWMWVVCVALGGAGLAIYALLFPSGALPDLLKGIGGAFISTCATFPYKNIPPRRERIISYDRLRRYFESKKISEEEERQIFLNLGVEALKVTVQRGPNA